MFAGRQMARSPIKKYKCSMVGIFILYQIYLTDIILMYARVKGISSVVWNQFTLNSNVQFTLEFTCEPEQFQVTNEFKSNLETLEYLELIMTIPIYNNLHWKFK